MTSNNRTAKEQEFLDFVRQHHKIGYGRMMQIISHEWHRVDDIGAMVVGTCVGLLPHDEYMAYLSTKESDPLFK